MFKLFVSFVSKHWRFILPSIAIAAILAALLFFPREQADESSFASEQIPLLLQEEIVEEVETEELFQEPSLILVDVKGAVQHPGVYQLVEGDRLIDAIEAAGGYLPTADNRLLNHAKKLSDEFVIYVPVEGEDPLPIGFDQQTESSENADSSKVNINIADEALLMTIPGIGPAKASAIIQYRTDTGLFQSPDDLKNVSGIGEKTFEKLASYITIANE